ncbi:hypothetical protein [Bacteroides clarus]
MKTSVKTKKQSVRFRTLCTFSDSGPVHKRDRQGTSRQQHALVTAIPTFGTADTNSRYKEYQRLVRRVPKAGTLRT